MALKILIKKAKLHPKKLFLIDGIGAMLSAFLLGIVLVKFETTFGIPSSVLYSLAIIPIFFAAYDFYCYQNKNLNTGSSLKRIAALNLMYCCTSIVLVLYHFKTVTGLGWTYIIIEIIIVLILVSIEFAVGRRVN